MSPKSIDNLKVINKNELAKRLDVTPALISLIASGKYTKSLEGPKARRVVLVLDKFNSFLDELQVHCP